jgi:hypothetical protein
VSEHGDRHCPPGAETAQKRKAGLLKLDAQPSAPESVFPRARHGRSLPRSGELAFRETYAASGPNREPGRIRRLRISLPARQWRLRDACGLSRLDDLVALWSQAHMPSCNRQVTSTSVHMAKPGSASAPSRSRTAIIGHIVFGSNNFRSPTTRRLRLPEIPQVRSADRPILQPGLTLHVHCACCARPGVWRREPGVDPGPPCWPGQRPPARPGRAGLPVWVDVLLVAA